MSKNILSDKSGNVNYTIRDCFGKDPRNNDKAEGEFEI